MSVGKRWMLVLLTTGICISGTASAQVEGIEWPGTWMMFGPVSWEDAADVDASTPGEVPAQLQVGGEALQGRLVQFDGERINLAALLGGHERQDTVFLFGEVRSERAVEAPIGAAADWWMAWWLNGEPLYDTLEAGNASQDFSVGAHTFKAPLRAGVNVLTVRVSGGRDGFLLAAGIPSPEQWDTLLQAARDEHHRKQLSDLIDAALLRCEAGDRSGARLLFHEALKRAAPGGAVALSLRLRIGESHELEGEPASASVVYAEMLAEEPPEWVRPVVQLRLAQALQAAGDEAAAQAAYRTLIRMNDAHPRTTSGARKALVKPVE